MFLLYRCSHSSYRTFWVLLVSGLCFFNIIIHISILQYESLDWWPNESQYHSQPALWWNQTTLPQHLRISQNTFLKVLTRLLQHWWIWGSPPSESTTHSGHQAAQPPRFCVTGCVLLCYPHCLRAIQTSKEERASGTSITGTGTIPGIPSSLYLLDAWFHLQIGEAMLPRCLIRQGDCCSEGMCRCSCTDSQYSRSPADVTGPQPLRRGPEVDWGSQGRRNSDSRLRHRVRPQPAGLT